MTRRLRKHPQHHPDHVDREHPRARKISFGMIWLLLAVLVLILVIGYDRRTISIAQDHIVSGQELEKQGLYVEALDEYQQALKNSRLGRKAKASVAVAMANIYYENLEDFPAAHRKYQEARQLSGAALQSEELQERARLAATKAKQTGAFSLSTSESENVATTRTVIQRVELLQQPLADTQGPVVAKYKGGQIHAGELLRALEKRPEFLRPDFREDPEKLRSFLDALIRDDLAYEAAVRAGVHKNPDVTERLYDYQRTLVAQRYAVDRRDEAMLVKNEDVEKYYNENRGQYVQAGQISVSLIKSDSETSAAEVLQMLRDGAVFADLATSFSTHQESAKRGGNIGSLTENDTTLEGIGEAPQVIDALFTMPIHSVSEVTPIAGAYYLFKITDVKPARNVTLEEARASIENLLRGRAVDKARTGLDQELQDVFEPQVEDNGLAQFWDFALKHGAYGVTTSSAVATSPTASLSTTGTSAATTTPSEAR